jgi:hypothetical protein
MTLCGFSCKSCLWHHKHLCCGWALWDVEAALPRYAELALASALLMSACGQKASEQSGVDDHLWVGLMSQGSFIASMFSSAGEQGLSSHCWVSVHASLLVAGTGFFLGGWGSMPYSSCIVPKRKYNRMRPTWPVALEAVPLIS